MEITLPGFATLVKLVGVDGQSDILPKADYWYLEGLFRLHAVGFASDPREFHDDDRIVTVVKTGAGDWELRTAPAGTRFAFATTPVKLQRPDGSGPWAQSDSVLIAKKLSSAPIVSLHTLSVSLVPDAPYVSSSFIYPAAAGAANTPLTQDSQGIYFGHFLQPDGDGFAVTSGSPKESALMDHVRGMNVMLPPDSSFKFRVPGARAAAWDFSASTFEVDATRSQFGVLVSVGDTSLLELHERDEDDAGSRIRVNKLEAAEHWLSVVEFADEKVKLQRRRSAAAGPTEESTRVFGPSERFSIHVPLKSDGSRPAQFVYQDENAGRDFRLGEFKPADAHYGLRIQGLGWAKGDNIQPSGNYAKLDADYLTLTFEGDRYEFLAGGKVKVRDQGIPDAVLLPKPNRSYGGRRVLDMPLGGMVLKCEAGAGAGDTPIVFDTRKATGQLQFKKIELIGPPVGASATGGTRLTTRGGLLREEADYAQWVLVLKREGGDESLAFDVTPEGAFPTEKDAWLNAFRNQSAEDFKLLEYPGARLAVDPPLRSDKALKAKVETKLVVKAETVGTTIKEKAVYSAIFVALSYPLVKHLLNSNQQSLPEDNIVFQATNLDLDANKDWVKKNEGTGRLVVVYYNQDGKIRDFIDDNTPSSPGGITDFIWPLTDYMAVLLWQREQDKPKKYCYQLAEDRGAPNTGLALDFSDSEKFEPGDLGWTEGWKKLQDESPDLWPRRPQDGEPAKGSRLDPSDRHWRGIMFRDMPVTLVLSEQVLNEIKQFEFLTNLFALINRTLVMEYGWKDESGATWKAGVEYKASGSGSITPGGWENFIRVDLLKFTVKGAAGKVIRAEGQLVVQFPLIKKKNSAEPVELRGAFNVRIGGGVALEKIELVPDIGGRIDTTSIPGFEKVEITRFSTDFKSGRLYLRLYPEPALAKALPFLQPGQPLDAQVAFNFKGTATFDIVLMLPAETQTNLFNKWQLSVQGVRVRFQPGVLTETIVACRLNLGLPGFSSVGAQVALTKKADQAWEMKVLIDRISGSLDLFGFRAGLDVKWATLDDATNPDPIGLPQGNIDEGKNRDIWGSIFLSNETGFLGGPHSLHFRIGTKGEMSYWVAALRISTTIKIGTAELAEPALLLARNADYGEILAKELADASNEVMQKLRPEIKEGKEFEWIAKWQPSNRVGMFIGASGFLSIHPEILTFPNKEPENLTGFGITSTGLIRIDAAGLFLKTFPIRFSLGLDLRNSILTAAFALTKEVSHGEFAIQPGQIVLGIGYGSKRYFLLSLGWPPRIGGDEYERDWSKSVMVRWDNAWPINTFWGGFRAEYNGVNNYIALGYALRVGWTKKYEKEIAVLKGSAELGVAVGGVFEFRYSWGRNSRLLVPMRQNPLLEDARAAFSAPRHTLVWSKDERDLAEAVEDLQPDMEATLEAMMRASFELEATYYADIWGSASGSILGVTVASVEVRAYARLHLCAGTSNRPLVSRVAGRLGFYLKIRILCFEFKVEASVDIVLIDGQCHGRSYFDPVPSFDEFLLTD